MPWPSYLAFLAVAAAVVVIPGPDVAVVIGNTAAGGRRRGLWCALGISTSNAIQGTAAVAGLGALVVNAQPVFLAIKIAGALYLAYLGIMLLRSAVRGRYAAVPADRAGGAARGWRQGFLSNITNPKVLVFYLAVLPQFLAPGMNPLVLAAFALSHALLSLLYLVLLTSVLHVARTLLTRRPVRRALDAVTDVALVGFPSPRTEPVTGPALPSRASAPGPSRCFAVRLQGSGGIGGAVAVPVSFGDGLVLDR